MGKRDMGLAPEILQARIKAQKAEEAKKRLLNPPPAQKVEEKPSVAPLPKGVTPQDALEKLPDEELWLLAHKKLARVDGRWSRSRLIDELVKAGVDAAAALFSPPPPPVA